MYTFFGPLCIYVVRSQATKFKIVKDFTLPQLLHLNEKCQKSVLWVSAFKCFDQLPHFGRVRGMSCVMTVKVCVFLKYIQHIL